MPFKKCNLWELKFQYTKEFVQIDLRWGIVASKGFIHVPINFLLAPICTPYGKMLFSIESTPHYKWINYIINKEGDKNSDNDYRSYLETYYPECNCYTGMEYVEQLVGSFLKNDPTDVIEIATYTPCTMEEGDRIIIFDGVHRAAIAHALKHNLIKCRIISDKFIG
jgi:hypothetical protein